MKTIEEWKKDFKEYIDGLYLMHDDYKGVMEYIDEVPTVETNIEVVAKDAYKQGYTDGWKERFGEPNERPQGELNADESRLIGEAVNYLLGADLVEENGWSENDIKVLQSLCERYYDEDSEEEE